jgi:signal transduction histidine kinase
MAQSAVGQTTAATADAPFPPTATEGGGVQGDVASAPSGWHALTRWLADNTFVPEWLPARWHYPSISYILAVALEVVAAFFTLGLVRALPSFSLPSALILLVVALTALAWGAGPSLAATLAGTALLEGLVLPHTTHGGVGHTSDVLEIAVFLSACGIIGVAATATERGRRRAVGAQAEAQARELALRETHARTDEFLSIAGHELRTPLTSLQMALQLAQRRVQRLIMRDDLQDDLKSQLHAVTEMLNTAEHQVKAQNRLVGDLLDAARVRAGKLTVHVAPCDVTTIVRDAVVAQRLVWPQRLIALDVPDSPVPVEVDAHRIEQVVTNYITNALKYAPPEAPVAVSLRRRGRVARVAVRDEGPGLTPEQQTHIWDRFHRVPGVKQQSGSDAGLGLGLYISRTIIELHGGQIGVESVPGHGAVFWFTLPLASMPSRG